jgi:hypothetical protein
MGSGLCVLLLVLAVHGLCSSKTLFGLVLGSLMLCAVLVGLAPFVIEQLFFREIRLYEHRIVRDGWLGEREIELANAKYLVDAYGGFHICSKDTGIMWASIKGIVFVGELADRNDAAKLVAVLTHLSKRAVGEVGRPLLWKDNFIKKGRNSPAVGKETLKRLGLHEDPGDKEFNRATYIALAVYVVFVSLALFSLLYFGILRNIR